MLVIYDMAIYFLLCIGIYAVYKGIGKHPASSIIFFSLLGLVVLFATRLISGVYKLIWRFGSAGIYVKLILTDLTAYLIYVILTLLVTPLLSFDRIPLILSTVLFLMELLLSLIIRLIYWYMYKKGVRTTRLGAFFAKVIRIASCGTVTVRADEAANKIKIAISGAGDLGSSLAEEINGNAASPYVVKCFIDSDPRKIGRNILDLPVISQNDHLTERLDNYEIQEVVVAIHNITRQVKKELYEYFSGLGIKTKVYDFPTMTSAQDGKRVLRDFSIDELLFRKQIVMDDEKANAYYRGKTVLITGGGGSIGSELCRQLARMGVGHIVIADIYENGAYEVEQEIKYKYGTRVKVNIEIVSVTNKTGLERVFSEYHPHIVINAAAHKHVPLMEKNCIEAVENNVFGTINTIELSEKYEVQRFIQVSTDKAVNPTNVMGATKRMCEMIVQFHALSGNEAEHKTTFSTTRFGNVLGSAGSVIPLFERMIKSGGPLRITDKRIIRYFMTIPEASQLVLQSGAMAKNGELFVLDMGKPVRIYDLAENMIKLSGLRPMQDIQIIETGLRPGEKLYEELLIQSETLSNTDNELIFIEKDNRVKTEELKAKIEVLRKAVESNSDEAVKKALADAVPTYHGADNKKTPADIFKKCKFKNEEARTTAEAIQNKRILVVDDVSLNRDIAVDTLIEIGLKAESAEDGAAAVTLLTSRGPGYYDYILMDLIMPGMTGYEAAEKIRSLEGAYKNIPIIAMTASNSGEKAKALASGMNDFIQKPLYMDQLLEILNRLSA